MVHPSDSLGSFIVDVSLRFSVSFLMSSTMECDFLLEKSHGLQQCWNKAGMRGFGLFSLEKRRCWGLFQNCWRGTLGKDLERQDKGNGFPPTQGRDFCVFPLPIPSRCCPCSIISKGVWATSWVLLQEHPLGMSSPQVWTARAWKGERNSWCPGLAPASHPPSSGLRGVKWMDENEIPLSWFIPESPRRDAPQGSVLTLHLGFLPFLCAQGELCIEG